MTATRQSPAVSETGDPLRSRCNDSGAQGSWGDRAAAKAVSRRDFRVSYVAVRVFVATDMADAIRQAQAAGATDITSISRNE